MRIDHYAYQKATRVAGFGLLAQAAIGLLLLLFGNMSGDTASIVASIYVLIGTLVWLGLIIIFHQHKLERLEALEEDELAATRAGAESFFDRAADETRVAARRLALMHKWLMPGFSLLIAALLAGAPILIWPHLDAGGTKEFKITEERGWAIAICLAVAGVSFIFSRFVAGMAKQQAWQNLRGGAAYMVGNALVMLAVALGIIFRFFDNDTVIVKVAYAIPIFMMLLAGEIALNFILNLYRPRIPGEVPRPAFDSKFLSLFATPDSIVRSLNEAVNYQFGFDVTSSWGYQLLLRSFFWLLGLGVAAMILLSTIVIVEPHQQAIRLRFGERIGDRVYQSGVMWKWPWPLESAEIHDVTRLRNLHLTTKVVDQLDRPVERRVYSWDSVDPPKAEGTIDSFIVGSPAAAREQAGGVNVVEASNVVDGSVVAATTQPSVEDKAATVVSNFYSLVDAEITLQYRIKTIDQDNENGLLEYLQFGTESIARRQSLSDRERTLKALALAEISRHFSRYSLDEVLSPGRTRLADDLRKNIQESFDRHNAGVQVTAVNLPMLRPSGSSAPSFEELNVSVQARRQRIAQVRRDVFNRLTFYLGNAAIVDQVLAAINEYDRLKAELGADAEQAILQRQHTVDLLVAGAGMAAQEIDNAKTDRWITLMSKRAQADRVQSQLAAYRAAPELYRQRETMKVYKQWLPVMDKYIIAIDPSQVGIDVDLKKISSLHEFAGASEEEKKQQ